MAAGWWVLAPGRRCAAAACVSRRRAAGAAGWAQPQAARCLAGRWSARGVGKACKRAGHPMGRSTRSAGGRCGAETLAAAVAGLGAPLRVSAALPPARWGLPAGLGGPGGAQEAPGLLHTALPLHSAKIPPPPPSQITGWTARPTWLAAAAAAGQARTVVGALRQALPATAGGRRGGTRQSMGAGRLAAAAHSAVLGGDGGQVKTGWREDCPAVLQTRRNVARMTMPNARRGQVP